MAIGPRVRERRKELGLTQEQLASQTGVTLSAVQRLEGGRITDPHYSTLLSIANALHTTVAELVGEPAAVPLGEASETGRLITRNVPDAVGVDDKATPTLIDALARVVDAWRAEQISREEAEREARELVLAA